MVMIANIYWQLLYARTGLKILHAFNPPLILGNQVAKLFTERHTSTNWLDLNPGRFK